MVSIGTATNRPVGFSLALGLLGGGALVATVSLTSRGPMIYLAYALIVIVTALYLRHERVQPFGRRFALALGTFMCASVVLYLFIGLVEVGRLTAISAVGHVWRLGLILGIGASVSGAVAQLTSTAPVEANCNRLAV